MTDKEYKIKESVLKKLVYKGVIFGANSGWEFGEWFKDQLEYELNKGRIKWRT